MTRMQIQLTDGQLEGLRKQAASSGRSLADLVREAVDLLLRSGDAELREHRRTRALEAAGRFASGSQDISQEHDRYLADTIAK